MRFNIIIPPVPQSLHFLKGSPLLQILRLYPSNIFIEYKTKYGEHVTIRFYCSCYGDNGLRIRFRNAKPGKKTDEEHMYKLCESLVVTEQLRAWRRQASQNVLMMYREIRPCKIKTKQ